jgi:glycosyltransferase involved in cell wall biosynthesis
MATRGSILFQGQLHRLCSFTLVNRRLVDGLARAGFSLTLAPTDGPLRPDSSAGSPELPDVFLVHDHPYDASSAPGRRNVFFLEYDYADLVPEDRVLVEQLNARFDLCLVPSAFVRTACRTAGIRIPIEVCPLGFDPDEFHPAVPPVPLGTERSFRFVNVGGATERKGLDVLVRAYRAAFTAADDVALVLKSQGYEHLRPWFRDVLGEPRAGEPEIVHRHGDDPSVAGWFTAADVGVFPFRGEGFGLPILECLASGRPVIVTEGGGPADFCSTENASFVRAKECEDGGRRRLEPDVEHLAERLRAAYEGRRERAAGADRIRATVADLTWSRTVERVVAAIDASLATASPQAQPTPCGVVHAYGALGETSWKKVATHVARGLGRRCSDFRAVGPLDRLPSAPPRVLLAESGFAWEPFAAARRASPEATTTILSRGNGPLRRVAAIVDDERVRCGLEPLPRPAPALWRDEQEDRLADAVLVFSRASSRHFVASGRAEETIRVIPLGMDARRPSARRDRDRLRFLFLATDPIRKGIRVLFEAWDALRPPNAELVCLVDEEVLRSKLLLRHLVRHPSIQVGPLVPHRDLPAVYEGIDVQVLPSLEDGYGVAIAEGMGFGKPAIVSTETGIADVLTDGEDALVVPAGSADALRDALALACDDPSRLDRMGEAAFATAERYPWRDFEEAVADLVSAYAENPLGTARAARGARA